MARAVAVIPHTHWDREWYQPFERFRHALVGVVDEVLDAVEADDGLPWFLLDGQMAMVDDYLAVRPEAEDRVRRLATERRISLGPWYVLMDEFCVSGETIVRNLQLGQRRAATLGGAMAVGYLPDMFGHIAQMPQLLRQAGMAHAVVWRGVPGTVRRSAFWWRALDGSTVRAEYLPVGYGIGAHLPREPDDLLRRLHAEEQEIGVYLRPGDTMLLLNGSDHLHPQRHVAGLVADTDRATRDFDLRMVSLPDYLGAAPTDALASWRGELRSCARANLLPGVLSNRTDIKGATAAAERALERLAEPMAALWLPAAAWPGAALDEAWLQLIRNSAHDSICACSADAVGRAVLARTDQAAAIAGAVVADAVDAASRAFSRRGPVVVNPSPRSRGGLVDVVLAGDEAPDATQVVERWPAARTERRGWGRDLHRLVGGLRRDGWLADGWGAAVCTAPTADGLEVRFVEDRSSAADPGLGGAVAEAFVRAGAGRDRPLRVVVERRAALRVLADAGAVPGYGWRAWEPLPLPGPPVHVGGASLDNGLVRVEVDRIDGTFALTGQDGTRAAALDRLVDDGDDGDTYTYSPPAVDLVVDRPASVTVRALEAGPLRGILEVTRRFAWPERLDGGQRVGARDVTVRSTLELRCGEEVVRVDTAFDNPSRDHRLRAVFDLPRPARSTTAECAFATVTRGLDPEPGAEERAVATYPSRRFVTAGDLTVTHEGLLEHELLDGGGALAVTLLRATGTLAKPAPAYRPNPAGPAIDLVDTEMVGPVRCRYAVALGVEDPFALADRVWTDLIPVVSAGEGHLGDEGAWLAVAGAEVSALRREGDRLEVRVFNPSERPAPVDLGGRSGVVVDLLGEERDRWSGQVVLTPWAIATLRLDPPAAPNGSAPQ